MLDQGGLQFQGARARGGTVAATGVGLVVPIRAEKAGGEPESDFFARNDGPATIRTDSRDR